MKLRKFNEIIELRKLELAREDIEHLSKGHLLDLIDVGFDVDITSLKGADDSLFIKIYRSGWFLRFGAKDQLLENCLFPFIEILKNKYEISFHYLEYNFSSSLEKCDLDFILSGEADFSMSTIYIECKII